MPLNNTLGRLWKPALVLNQEKEKSEPALCADGKRRSLLFTVSENSCGKQNYLLAADSIAGINLSD